MNISKTIKTIEKNNYLCKYLLKQEYIEYINYSNFVTIYYHRSKEWPVQYYPFYIFYKKVILNRYLGMDML